VLHDTDRLNSMAAAARRQALPGAADEIAAIILESARA
jgi:UDP-N-acetylglucosamine:LPS N-acetylglucosamine transferase